MIQTDMIERDGSINDLSRTASTPSPPCVRAIRASPSPPGGALRTRDSYRFWIRCFEAFTQNPFLTEPTPRRWLRALAAAAGRSELDIRGERHLPGQMDSGDWQFDILLEPTADCVLILRASGFAWSTAAEHLGSGLKAPDPAAVETLMEAGQRTFEAQRLALKSKYDELFARLRNGDRDAAEQLSRLGEGW